MKMKLSLVALALLNVGAAHAVSFNLNDANTANINKSKWSCKRCDNNVSSGTVGLSVLAIDSDDKRAVNTFGDEDGTAVAVQADAVMQDSSQGRLALDADNLGAETGYGQAKFDNDLLGFTFGYRSNLHVDSDKGQTQYGIYNGVIQDIEERRDVELSKKREQFLLGTELKGDNWRGFIDYNHMERTGKQVSSSQFIGVPDANRSGAPINYVAPIEQTTQTLIAGGELLGERWLAGLKYQGSLFENDYDGINSFAGGSIESYEPENEAHQLIANGQYRFERHSISGCVVKGWMYQDQAFTTTEGVPAGVVDLDGEVQTLDVNARWNYRASSQLRVKAKFDYRDRDNKTDLRLFESLDYDPNTGRAVENVALDSERTAYQLDANYRIAKGFKINGGYQRIDKEQTDTVRDETNEDRFYAGVRYDQLAMWNFHLNGEFSSRDGSSYQADEATSNEDNALLRKYHLADRDRNEVTLKVSHTPMINLVIDANVRYANDDYDSTDIGLTEATDSGYDISLNYQPMANLNVYLFGGQQWIESDQTDLNSAGRYSGQVEDTFSHIGVGSRYDGLWQDKLAIGVDYSFSESESDTEVGGSNVYGDYNAWSHNVDLYAEYQLTAKASVKANYGYERYYDTNYGSVNSSSYTTLGNLDSNYVAHLVMLTFNYAL
ncbi:MtrB/PioB family decaheme-associated outer membrane protein [Ferrimonas lipolytica]|uniref:MtrB/PioB family decaheme-associated outer membrane protein n=1 Tax=Ferrimonas lipolytica TaxID=2724191 RepID=A0A6H1UG61_9GAMM|nr:MtrB/PioB family decaheme-associated outer membrane protein [Ferrimonas lipolytica]QIZ78034.1 MtrB/PioB family decaheme-associated outer membrane protein [Ferrimonas lipolytica]